MRGAETKNLVYLYRGIGECDSSYPAPYYMRWKKPMPFFRALFFRLGLFYMQAAVLNAIWDGSSQSTIFSEAEYELEATGRGSDLRGEERVDGILGKKKRYIKSHTRPK